MNTERLIAKHDFLAFAQVALRELDGTEMSDDRYLEVLASELMRLADGSSKRLLINLPPRHLKTMPLHHLFCRLALGTSSTRKNFSRQLLAGIG